MQTPANAPTKVAEDVKSILLNRVVVEYYILRFFCDDATTSFAFDFHKIFSQTNFSLSLVSLTLSSVASEYDDDDDDDDDAFCER